jgi:hypothetical protein
VGYLGLSLGRNRTGWSIRRRSVFYTPASRLVGCFRLGRAGYSCWTHLMLAYPVRIRFVGVLCVVLQAFDVVLCQSRLFMDVLCRRTQTKLVFPG